MAVAAGGAGPVTAVHDGPGLLPKTDPCWGCRSNKKSCSCGRGGAVAALAGNLSSAVL